MKRSNKQGVPCDDGRRPEGHCALICERRSCRCPCTETLLAVPFSSSDALNQLKKKKRKKNIINELLSHNLIYYHFHFDAWIIIITIIYRPFHSLTRSFQFPIFMNHHYLWFFFNRKKSESNTTNNWYANESFHYTRDL